MTFNYFQSRMYILVQEMSYDKICIWIRHFVDIIDYSMNFKNQPFVNNVYKIFSSRKKRIKF